ncbi:unnamed protein product [Prunus armeniaca]|uniref:Uncharacterized protein n=1 Tax=Prunus armeniaca TaxID=36596 RepID=A0A6J5UBA8_PRUAR|nr:unnamed protein product [Prunus armeniaca]
MTEEYNGFSCSATSLSLLHWFLLVWVFLFLARACLAVPVALLELVAPPHSGGCLSLVLRTELKCLKQSLSPRSSPNTPYKQIYFLLYIPSSLAFSLFWIRPLHWATTTTSTSEVSHIYWKVYRALAMAPALVFAPPSSTLGFGPWDIPGWNGVVFSMVHRQIWP